MNISDKRFPYEAWKAVNERRPFSFTVNGTRSRLFRKSVKLFVEELYEEYWRANRSKKKDWVCFRFYALLTPICWSVIFTALNNGMTFSCEEGDNFITVRFALAS